MLRVHGSHVCWSSVTYARKGHVRVPKKAREKKGHEWEHVIHTVNRAVSTAGMCGQQTDTREQAILFHSSSFLMSHFFCLFPHFALFHLPSFTTATRLSIKNSLSLPFSPSAEKQTGGVLTFWKVKVSCILNSACFSRQMSVSHQTVLLHVLLTRHHQQEKKKKNICKVGRNRLFRQSWSKGEVSATTVKGNHRAQGDVRLPELYRLNYIDYN